MRDIVKRLRNAAEYDVGFGPLLREAAEAADEIERLRKEVVSADATIRQQRTKIERLIKEVAELRAATGDRWISVADSLPPDGEWCWVHGANFNGPFPAVRRRVAAGGWHNEDTWEDWDGEVERWFPMAQPPAVEGE